ncbi:MAG: alpha/beta fold hydrolase [Burkholderiaceae bacterium]
MPHLVLIPGLNNTAAAFDGVIAALPAAIQPHPVNCPALPSVDAIADALAAGFPERFWLAGFSFGGYVAMAILERYRARVQGIAMLCSTPFADSDAQRERRQAAIERARKGEHLAMVEAASANTMHPDSLKNPALVAARRAMVADYGAQRYIAHTQAVMARPDRSALLDGSLPTLVMTASHDQVVPPASVLGYAARIPGARTAVVEAAGHLAVLEQPAAVASLLAAWIGDAGTATAASSPSE